MKLVVPVTRSGSQEAVAVLRQQMMSSPEMESVDEERLMMRTKGTCPGRIK